MVRIMVLMGTDRRVLETQNMLVRVPVSGSEREA